MELSQVLADRWEYGGNNDNNNNNTPRRDARPDITTVAASDCRRKRATNLDRYLSCLMTYRVMHRARRRSTPPPPPLQVVCIRTYAVTCGGVGTMYAPGRFGKVNWSCFQIPLTGQTIAVVFIIFRRGLLRFRYYDVIISSPARTLI